MKKNFRKLNFRRTVKNGPPSTVGFAARAFVVLAHTACLLRGPSYALASLPACVLKDRVVQPRNTLAEVIKHNAQ